MPGNQVYKCPFSFYLKDSEKKTDLQNRCDENNIEHGAELDGGDPVVEVVAENHRRNLFFFLKTQLLK